MSTNLYFLSCRRYFNCFYLSKWYWIFWNKCKNRRFKTTAVSQISANHGLLKSMIGLSLMKRLRIQQKLNNYNFNAKCKILTNFPLFIYIYSVLPNMKVINHVNCIRRIDWFIRSELNWTSLLCQSFRWISNLVQLQNFFLNHS